MQHRVISALPVEMYAAPSLISGREEGCSRGLSGSGLSWVESMYMNRCAVCGTKSSKL
jgi:hypothetical protein